MKGKIAIITGCAGCPYLMFGNTCGYTDPNMNVQGFIESNTMPETCPLPFGDDGYESVGEVVKKEQEVAVVASKSLVVTSEAKKPTWELTDALGQFASQFSERWQDLKVGLYQSEDKKYSVRLEENEESMGRTHSSGTVHFNRNKMLTPEPVPNDFVFYLFIWCMANGTIRNTEETDRVVTEYYATLERLPTEVLKGLTIMFGEKPTPQNLIRFQNICDILGIMPDGADTTEEE
jgi:hypothetical protein